MLNPAAPPESALPASASARPATSQTWMLAAVLGLLTVALYWPVTQHDFLNYDDDAYVTSNVHVQKGVTLAGLKWAFCSQVGGNWHPLTMLSHMLDCQLYGLKPWGHHLTNLLFHALNSGLLFVLLRRLTGTTWRCVAMAALFAWHPLQVDTVAWVAERKNVLSTSFGLLTLLFYTRYVCGEEETNRGALGGRSGARAFYRSPFYWLAWFCFALGLMAKPMLVTWPFAMLLLDYWPLKRFETSRLWTLVFEKIPFFLLSAAASVITFVVQKQAGAVAPSGMIPLDMRLGNAPVSYCRYLLKFLWPSDLAVFYPYVGYWPLGWVLLSSIFLCGLSALFWLKRKRLPFLFVGWFWFVGTLVPVIGLVQAGTQSLADRYMYVPLIGILLLTVWGLCELSRNWRRPAMLLSLVGSGAIFLCSAVTRQEIRYWKDSETLFRRALAVTPWNDIALNNLGAALLTQGKTNEAPIYLQQAFELNPARVEAHVNLGTFFVKSGQLDAAIAQFKEAIRLKPDYRLAYCRLGEVFTQKDQTNEAISQYQEAIRLDPTDPDTLYHLGNLLAKAGQTDAAINQFQKAVQLVPNDADAHYNLGNMLSQGGHTDSAVREFQETIRLNPVDYEVHYKLGNLLAKGGLADEAIAQFQEAVRFKPDFAEAHNNLGSLFSARGRTNEAIIQFQAALQIKPDYTDAHYNLGNIFFKNGRFDEAITQYQKVSHLSPNLDPVHYYLAIALYKRGLTNEAITQFQETIRLKPDNAVAHNKLGMVLRDASRTDEAISEFREATRLKPDYLEASNNLAQVMAAKHDRESH